MTHINPDDPKWTAYVLGELDESERAAVELEIQSSEKARTLVEELRFAAEMTKTELRDALAVAPLSPEQREAIHASAAARRPRRWFAARTPVWVAGLAAAGIAVIALTLQVRPPRYLQQEVHLSAAQQGQSAQTSTAPSEAPVPLQLKDEAKLSEEFGLRYEHRAAPSPVPKVAEAPRAESTATNELVVPTLPVEPKADVARSVPNLIPAEPAAAAPVAPAAKLSGIVQDATAARIPGAAITATNIETGASASTTTDQQGAYRFDGLQPGKYKLSASLPGFQTATADNIQLGASAQAKDMTLQVATMAETLRVVTELPLNASVSAGAKGRPGRSGAAGGQIAQEARSFRELPAPPPAAPSTIPNAPGVPPSFDRRRPFPNGGEAYDNITDNPFLPVAQNPLSTFSIDVDTASYSNVRRFLSQSQLPPRDAVRVEEMVNYFTYDYPQPAGNNPIGAAIEAASVPWSPQHRLVRVAIKARDIEARRRPPSNLVFLLDVSGSMEPAERLPLLKNAMRMLVDQLTANDHVTVVTYAGTTGVALRPTRGDQKDVILSLIDSLQAGGSTNGGSGIQLAYEEAMANFVPGGVNRIILATDGDFNVGVTNRNALLRLIEDKAKSGVFLSVLGVGMGNYKDATLEMLADKGHGNYAYLDTLNEARKVLVEQMTGTLITVAKDVKVQVEFNPAVVDAYRLIGYENRALRNEDFNNDLKDAGDMGAGHTVTVLYEVVPRGVGINAPSIDPLKYQQPVPAGPAAPAAKPDSISNETLTVKIRYKEPTASDSKLLAFPLVDREQTFARASVDFRFAAAVASFGMILRESQYKGTSTFDSVLNMAEDSVGSDRNGYRREFLQLVQRARQIRR